MAIAMCRSAADVDFGACPPCIEGQIAEDWLAFRAQWFDRWLKPATSEVTRPEPVARIFLMGGGSGARNAEGTHATWWRVDSVIAMAAGRHALHVFLLARRRRFVGATTRRSGRIRFVCVRSGESRPYNRWSH